MTTAVKQSAAVSASIESLRSARSLADGRRSVYQPRVEARVRGVGGRNVEGLQDQTRNTGRRDRAELEPLQRRRRPGPRSPADQPA
jgi:hypothetical protein